MRSAGDERLERLRLLASAIAGRPLEVTTARPGHLTWTDGATVYLEPGASRPDRLRMLCVQASLLAGGSLDAGVVRQLGRRPSLTRRYLAIEAHRALAANEDLLPARVRSMIDRALVDGVDTPAASLALARERRRIADTPPVLGEIHPRRMLAPAGPTTTGRPEHFTTRSTNTPPAELEDDDEDDGERYVGHLLASPVGDAGPLGRLLQRLLAPARSRSGGGFPGADAPTHVTRSRPGAARGFPPTHGAPGGMDDEPALVLRGVVYPEWDVFRRQYRPDWCTVVESVAPASGDVVASTGVFALRRSLARLGLGLMRCHRQLQGDDVDLDAAVEARVEAMAASPPTDAVYVDSLRRRRDVGVLVLLDVSGSANEPGTLGETIHTHQRSVAGALTLALHDLGDRVALYAFNSRGRQAVQLLRVKAFDEHFDARVERRLRGLEPAAYTRLGAAIRHGTAVLESQVGTPRRLLVVLSDGLAYDHGYEGRYGEEDSRRALGEARRRGVGCLCLSVGTDTDAASLRRVFGAAAHAAVPRLDQLPDVIGPLFRSALHSAEARRRAFTRTERTRERHELDRRCA